MVLITKKEKEAIIEKFPDVYIIRTMKQRSKRHRYYCEEKRPVMQLLRKLRGGADERKDGGRYTDGKKK